MPIDPRIYMQYANQMPRGEKTGMLNQFTGNYDQMRQRQIQMDEQARRDRIQQEQMKMNALRAEVYERQASEFDRKAEERNALNSFTNDMTSMQEMPNTMGPMPGGGMPMSNRESVIQQAGADGLGMAGLQQAGVINEAMYPRPKELPAKNPTDLGGFVRNRVQQWKEENPGKEVPTSVKADAFLEGKRAQSGEITRTKTAGKEVDLAYDPVIASDVESGKLGAQFKWKPAIQRAVKLAEKEAIERGDVLTDLGRATAAMPGLLESIGQLKDLASVATSTMGGRAFDLMVRESGFGGTKGANARAKFIAIVDNQVLPLLKPTFGAAFTVMEGDALRATMGDPDLSPSEKMGQLEAFISQKYRDIQTKERQLGKDLSLDDGKVEQGGEITTQAGYDELPSGAIYTEDGKQYRKP